MSEQITKKQILPSYSRIYFDSNIMIRMKWPSVSSVFQSTVELASSMFKIPTIFLRPVEFELKAHCLRDYQKTRKEGQSKMAELNRILQVAFDVPSYEMIATAYDEIVKKRIKGLPLIRRAPSLRKTQELFNMAINKARPFGEMGKNFQDAVICLAAIDDLKHTPPFSGVFITDDAGFDQEVLDELCEPCGVKLTLFRSFEELTDDLRGHLKAVVLDAWKDDEENARSLVSEKVDLLKSFLNENLEISPRRGFSMNRIQSLDRIEISEITKIVTPPLWERNGAEELNLTVTLSVKLYVTERVAAQPLEGVILKVGQSVQPRQTHGPFYTNRPAILDKFVSLEVKARFAKGKYVDMTPVSISNISAVQDNISRTGTEIGVI